MKTPFAVKRLRILPILSVAAMLTSALALPMAHAQDFNLLDANGKNIGKSTFTIDKTKDGYKVHTRFQYMTSPNSSGDARADASTNELRSEQGASDRPVEMQFTGSYKVTATGNLTEATLLNAPTQTTIELQVSKSRDSISLTKIQGYQPGNPMTLPMPKPDFMVAPTEDPSAIQILLTTALAHPHPDNTYLLLIPPTSPRAGAKSIFVSLQPPTDATGTLDGRPVALKHYVLKFYEGEAHLYADANGTLLEADMDPLHAKYVHTKFALSTPPK